eukprot:6051609-Pleurochrysis_carterae.AAC.4
MAACVRERRSAALCEQNQRCLKHRCALLPDPTHHVGSDRRLASACTHHGCATQTPLTQSSSIHRSRGDQDFPTAQQRCVVWCRGQPRGRRASDSPNLACDQPAACDVTRQAAQMPPKLLISRFGLCPDACGHVKRLSEHGLPPVGAAWPPAAAAGAAAWPKPRQHARHGTSRETEMKEDGTAVLRETGMWGGE